VGSERNTGTGHRVAAVAERQHGVVSTRQLRTLGLTDQMIATRVASGALHPVFRGVFAVGHPGIDRRGRLLAAALACGDGSVISHGSAAELLGLWDVKSALVDLIARGQSGRKIDGVRWHRVRMPGADEVTVCEGILCTTASRTLVDLAGKLRRKSLARLVEQAAVLRLLDVEGVDRMLARGRRLGAGQLRAILAPWRGGQQLPRLRSGLEARLLAAVLKAGLPRPRCNAQLQVEGQHLEVDFLWAEQRLVIETDGAQFHETPTTFRRDRWRDQLLTAAGYRTARVTWSQLEDET
jgi:very-short-patch-repair endonuclease